MNNQIKNFIEEGEKEAKIEFDNWVQNRFQHKYRLSGEFTENIFKDYEDQWKCEEFIKNLISSRQISLIKMIVDMVESEREHYWVSIDKSESVREIASQIGKDGYNQALDTISSKLKELYD